MQTVTQTRRMVQPLRVPFSENYYRPANNDGLLMDGSPDCSLVVPIHEPRFPLLPELLASIENQSTDASVEVLIVNDGGDPDELVTYVDFAAYETPIRIDHLRQNEGASSARNRGLELASGEFILFVDSDCELKDGFVQSHYELNRESDAPGVVGGSEFVNQETLTAEVIEEAGYWSVPFRLPYTRIPASWGPTLNLSIKADRVTDKRFDPAFPARGGGEDVDFCWQITNSDEEQPFLRSEDPVVEHPSWGIKAGLTRFFRWGRAEAMLMEKYPDHRTFAGLPIPLLFAGLLAVGAAGLVAGLELVLVVSILVLILGLEVVDFAGKIYEDLTAPAIRDPRYTDFDIPKRLFPILYGFEIVWQCGVFYQLLTTAQLSDCLYRLNYFPEVDTE